MRLSAAQRPQVNFVFAFHEFDHARSIARLPLPFAEPTVRTIYQRIRSLGTAPYKGRPGNRSGTRELPLSPLPYVVVYLVKPEAVEILHIHHGAQDWRSQ